MQERTGLHKARDGHGGDGALVPKAAGRETVHAATNPARRATRTRVASVTAAGVAPS